VNNRESRINETEVYEECHLRLYRISYGILKNRFQAEEVMHDTLLKYFGSSYSFATARDRDRWMTRVCVNSSLDQLRINKREESRVDKSVPVESIAEESFADVSIGNEGETGCGITEADIIKSERAGVCEFSALQEGYNEQLDAMNVKGFTSRDILKAIELLPLGYRLVVSLYLTEGYDYQEISMITGLKESTVRSQYVRAKIRILDILNGRKIRKSKKR
jgi:RNA polymerase sigma-70 factor (ECF subfamily)